jgi:hypothetical protein
LGTGFASTRTPEFRALNPNGLVPVIESDGGILWESNTICRYLASRHGSDDLLAASPWRRAPPDKSRYPASNLKVSLRDIQSGLGIFVGNRYFFPDVIVGKGEPVQADLQKDMTVWFRSLAPVKPVEMVGLWRGVGIPSGHPLEGVLENLRWFGKRFHPDMRADALLFQWHPGRLVAMDPRFAPVGLAIKLAPFGRTALARTMFSYFQKLLRARGTTAALEVRAFEQIASAAMVYNEQPIVDHFRRVDENTLAGMMCVRDDERRFFFKLTKMDAQG